jgi:hypothetical protein
MSLQGAREGFFGVIIVSKATASQLTINQFPCGFHRCLWYRCSLCGTGTYLFIMWEHDIIPGVTPSILQICISLARKTSWRDVTSRALHHMTAPNAIPIPHDQLEYTPHAAAVHLITSSSPCIHPQIPGCAHHTILLFLSKPWMHAYDALTRRSLVRSLTHTHDTYNN